MLASTSLKSILNPSAFKIDRPDDVITSKDTSPRDLHESTTAQQIPTTPTKGPISVHNDTSNNIREKRPGNHWGKFSGDFTSSHEDLFNTPEKYTRPSVAELRRSFEQNVSRGALSFLPQTPTKTSLKSVRITQHSNRESRDLERPSSSFRHSQSIPHNTPNQPTCSVFTTPPSIKGLTHRKGLKGEKPEKPEQFSPIPPAPRTHWGNSIVSLLISDQFRQKENEVSDPTTSHISLPALSQVESCITKLDDPRSLTKLTEAPHSKTLPKSKSGDSFFARMSQTHQDPVVRTPAKLQKPIPVQVNPMPESTPKADVPPRRIGKVSDLRKLFDRPFNRSSSPGPSRPFSQQGHRGAMEDMTHDVSRLDGQPRLMDSHSSKTCVPSLTTEISINDFFSTFSERLVDPQAITAMPAISERLEVTNVSPKKPSGLDSPTRPEALVEHSPVRGCIRHFESLEQINSAQNTPTNNTNLRVAFQRDQNVTNRGRELGGWRPIRQRGARMWRRISQTFSHSLYNGDDNPDNLHGSENSSLHATNAYTARSPSSMSAGGFRARHSGFFGHRLYRTSDVRRSSTAFSSRPSSRAGLDIDETLISTLDDDVSYPSCNRRYDRSPPPLLTHQRISPSLSFPSLEHISSSPGNTASRDFAMSMGLDGNVESQHQHDYESRGESEADALHNNSNYHKHPSALHYASPRPVTPQGDPSALAKVRSQQTSSREARRRNRYDEKKRRQELKADEKHFRREQQQMDHDERENSGGINSPSISLPLIFPFSSIHHHHKNKNKGKQRATDANPEEQVSIGAEDERTDTSTSRTTAEALGASKHSKDDKKGKKNSSDKEKKKQRKRDRSWGKKTESGFVIRHAEVEKIRQPKPSRPGQVKKLVNFYRDRTSSSGMLIKLGGKGGAAGANSGEGSAKGTG